MALANVVEAYQPLYVLYLKIVGMMKTTTSPSHSYEYVAHAVADK
jgi:hypothetical protein